MSEFDRLFNQIWGATSNCRKETKTTTECCYDRFFDDYKYQCEAIYHYDEIYSIKLKKLKHINENGKEWFEVVSTSIQPINFDINNWVCYVNNNKNKKYFKWNKTFLY